MVDLVHRNLVGEGRTPQRETVETGPDQYVLTNASQDGSCQRVLREARAQDHVPVRGEVSQVLVDY